MKIVSNLLPLAYLMLMYKWQVSFAFETTAANTTEEETKFDINNISFLEYMLLLKTSHDTTDDGQYGSVFIAECNQRRYLISAYHTVVYESLCPLPSSGDLQSPFDFRFCNDFNQTSSSAGDEDIFYSLQACDVLRQYKTFTATAAESLNHTASTGSNVTYEYKELVIDDLAFCSTFTIPYWTENGKLLASEDGDVLNLQHSMSPGCSQIVYTTIIIDIIVSILIVLLNFSILIIVAKTNVLSNEFG